MANTKKHPLLQEAIDNAKKAAASTRGMYPYTVATNVFMADGKTVEEKVSTTPTPEPSPGA